MSKQKNKSKPSSNDHGGRNKFEINKLVPMTSTQARTISSYNTGRNLVLHGYAGTGKTYVPLHLALDEVLGGSPLYGRVVIIRSVVPSRDIGFLPGSPKEKVRIYEEPYREICTKMFGRGDAYDILKLRGVLDFTTTSFLRGMTFENSIIIVDEIQNMAWSELHTVMTRVGDNSKIVFCGDYRQTDLQYDREKSGLQHFLNITKKMNMFDYIEFDKEDICRGKLVKEFIIKCAEAGPPP